MDQDVTVGVRGLVVTALVVLALGVAYLLGGGRDAPAAVAATGGGPPAAGPGTLTTAGEGSVRVVPDQVGFTVSVGATRPDLDDAFAVASRTMRRVHAALAAHDVRARDVQTTDLSMEPVYDYPAGSAPVLRGYRVRQESDVLVRELRGAGAAIGAVVAAGGNSTRVGDVTLRVGHPDAALADARAAAVEDATAEAEEYAAATGQALGDVRTLREVGPARDREQPVPLAELDAQRATKALDAPIRAGRAAVTVEVEVVWELAGTG